VDALLLNVLRPHWSERIEMTQDAAQVLPVLRGIPFFICAQFRMAIASR